MKYYRQLIEIAADPVYVGRARAELRELEILALGQPAPRFDAVDVLGRPLSLSALEGKVVLLEFWATFCAPCLPELDNLERLREKYADEELVIIGVSFDRSADVLKRFLKRRNLGWPQLCDGKGADGEIAGLYNVEQIPRSFVIDREGKIAAKDHRADKLAEVLRKLIATSDLDRVR